MTRSHPLLPRLLAISVLSVVAVHVSAAPPAPALALNAQEYLEMPGLDVMLAHDYYPEGHQGGVGIIQNGLRVATNGDLRLDRTPGQWQPVPKVSGTRVVDRASGEISVRLEYPDETKNRKGFNPVEYPDLAFAYTLRVRPEGQAVRVVVDLDRPLPDRWIGTVGFNLELFPGLLFGKSWATESASGIFPRQPVGPGTFDDGAYHIEPIATGRRLVVAPESDRQRLVIENAGEGLLELVDGRGQHNNGWFVVRSLVAKGRSARAIEWVIRPHAIPGWMSDPVVQVSQVGYHPDQQKFAVVELDRHDTRRHPVVVSRLEADGRLRPVVQAAAPEWGDFLRYHYLRLDFTTIVEPGMYVASYGDVRSNPFRIAKDVFARGIWQPTLEYFLPIQMCHVRVNERYRVWHDACHLDDARMAPTSYNHFDGYLQGPSTLTRFAPGEPVPGLNVGGWHDAGDDDLRVESQADTIHGLALAYEAFGERYDGTTIDESRRVVEIQRPDGTPDLLQQIQHGVLTVAGSYRALGRFYRGMIVPTQRQYTHLGEFSSQTDNLVFDPKAAPGAPPPIGTGLRGSADDRWVFTEEHPERALGAAAGLAAAARALAGYDEAMAAECRRIAEEIWISTPMVTGPPARPGARLELAVELLLTTKDRKYAEYILGQRDAIVTHVKRTGWIVGRALNAIGDDSFTSAVTDAVRGYRAEVDRLEKKTPYGVPYEPDIWGAGWGIQSFGMEQYFLHTAFPEIFPKDLMLHALTFVLGCHPGANTASFVSGVGARSITTAYGFNRADWSYIPGGSVSGTALIRPDYPELLEWPFLWQQTEYVLGGGTTDYLFLVMAADHLLNGRH